MLIHSIREDVALVFTIQAEPVLLPSTTPTSTYVSVTLLPELAAIIGIGNCVLQNHPL